MQFECCGVDSPDYWDTISLPTPASCCGKDHEGTCAKPYEDGCAKTIYDFLVSSAKVIGGVVIGIVVTEVGYCLLS